MSVIKFDKMQGAGNDYIYVDNRDNSIVNPESLAISISDRHFGVGSDGLVLIMQSEIGDFRMRMFNADGSEAGMCGNASRCVGKYIYEKGFTTDTEIALETKSGLKILSLTVDNGVVKGVSVDMNEPLMEAADIPVASDTPHSVLIKVADTEYKFRCVSMGNPHAVTFINDVDNFDVEGVGRQIENNPLFPERTNVEFAEMVSPTEIKMRVWERGSGETLACGTGACATLVAASLNGLSSRKGTIKLLGGEVEVEWREETNHVILTGGAEWVFSGEYYID